VSKSFTSWPHPDLLIFQLSSKDGLSTTASGIYPLLKRCLPQEFPSAARNSPHHAKSQNVRGAAPNRKSFVFEIKALTMDHTHAQRYSGGSRRYRMLQHHVLHRVL
jgi:hypothetical protein